MTNLPEYIDIDCPYCGKWPDGHHAGDKWGGHIDDCPAEREDWREQVFQILDRIKDLTCWDLDEPGWRDRTRAIAARLTEVAAWPTPYLPGSKCEAEAKARGAAAMTPEVDRTDTGSGS